MHDIRLHETYAITIVAALGIQMTGQFEIQERPDVVHNKKIPAPGDQLAEVTRRMHAPERGELFGIDKLAGDLAIEFSLAMQHRAVVVAPREHGLEDRFEILSGDALLSREGSEQRRMRSGRPKLDRHDG